jgi:hypothetical protein
MVIKMTKMTMKMAPVTKSGCADAVGYTVSSAVAGALVISDGDPTGPELNTGAGDGDTDGDTDTDADGVADSAAGNVAAVDSLAITTALTCPRSATSLLEESLLEERRRILRRAGSGGIQSRWWPR